MIDFTYEVIVPANTPFNDPYTVELKLHKGVLRDLYIIWADGCFRSVYVQFWSGEIQIAPVIAGMGYALNDYVLHRPLNMGLDKHPYSVVFRGWSPGTKHPHTIGLVFGMDTEEQTMVSQLAKLLFGG